MLDFWVIEDLPQWQSEYLAPSILWFSCPRALGKETVWRGHSYYLMPYIRSDIHHFHSQFCSCSLRCITNNYNLVAYNNDNICFAHKFENWTGLGGDSLSLLHLVSLGIAWRLRAGVIDPLTPYCCWLLVHQLFLWIKNLYWTFSCWIASGHGGWVLRVSVQRGLGRSCITFYNLAW